MIAAMSAPASTAAAPRRMRLELDDARTGQRAVDAALRELLADTAVDERRAEQIAIAVGEAVANALEHGRGGGRPARAHAELCVADGELAVTVSDDGPGCDPGAVPDPRAPQRLLVPHGRGLLLMTSLMDRVSVSARAGGGCVVQLRTTVTAAAADTRTTRR